MAAKEVEFDVSRALVAKYIDVATTSLVFYDWSTSLADEIELVWRAPSRSLLKYVFIILRYTTLTAQPISLLYDFILTESERICKKYVRTIIALTYIVLACTEFILLLRFLNAHRGNKRLFRIACALYICSMFTAALIVAVWAHNLTMTVILFVQPGEEPLHILPGCWSPIGGKILYVPYGILILWEIVISTATFLRTWKNYMSTGTPFWSLFFRDGNHFYAWVLAISFISLGLVGMIIENGTFLLQDRIIFALTRTVHSVCVTRLLLHVRRQSRLSEEEETTLQGGAQSFQLIQTHSNTKTLHEEEEDKYTTSPIKHAKRLAGAWKEKNSPESEFNNGFQYPQSETNHVPPNLIYEDVAHTDIQSVRDIDNRESESDMLNEWMLRVNTSTPNSY